MTQFGRVHMRKYMEDRTSCNYIEYCNNLWYSYN